MIYFGAGSLLFFAKPSKSIAFSEQDFLIRAVSAEALRFCTFCFYKDLDTGFYKFVKFRANNKPSGRFYYSFDHVLEEISSNFGSDIASLRRMKEYRYSRETDIEVLKAMKEEWYK